MRKYNKKLLAISVLLAIILSIIQRILNLSATTIYHLGIGLAILDELFDLVLFTIIIYLFIIGILKLFGIFKKNR